MNKEDLEMEGNVWRGTEKKKKKKEKNDYLKKQSGKSKEELRL